MNHYDVIRLIVKDTKIPRPVVRDVLRSYQKVVIRGLEEGDSYSWAGMFSIKVYAYRQSKKSQHTIFAPVFKPNAKKMSISPGCRLQRAVGIITRADKKKYYRLRRKTT